MYRLLFCNHISINLRGNGFSFGKLQYEVIPHGYNIQQGQLSFNAITVFITFNLHTGESFLVLYCRNLRMWACSLNRNFKTSAFKLVISSQDWILSLELIERPLYICGACLWRPLGALAQLCAPRASVPKYFPLDPAKEYWDLVCKLIYPSYGSCYPTELHSQNPSSCDYWKVSGSVFSQAIQNLTSQVRS